MIRYENQDLIGGAGRHRGGYAVAVAARGLARPGCGGRWLTGRPGGWSRRETGRAVAGSPGGQGMTAVLVGG